MFALGDIFLRLVLNLLIWAWRQSPELAVQTWPSTLRGLRLAGAQLVTVWTIVALLLGTTNTNVHAQTYNPVFYYYLPDQLGSSQIMLDRSGQRVQHYENTAFGKQRFQDNTSAFPMSHRFTG